MTETRYTIETVTTGLLVAHGWDREDAWEALGRRHAAVIVSNPGCTASQTLYHLGCTHRRSDSVLAGAAGIYNTEEEARLYIAAEQSASS